MNEGLKSEALLGALSEALHGRPERLEDLLVRHGGLPGPKPNLKLAAAFGFELATLPSTVAPLLTRFADDEARADSSRVFLPIAAAHGWAQRLRAGREQELGWRALQELSADERGPVRVGTLDAVIELAAREGGADTLVERARGWLDEDDRELAFGATALVIEALGDVRVLGGARDHEALLSYLSQAIDKVADAPRSAERSDGRRRALTSLARTLGAVVALVRAGDRGLGWFEAECERAKQPDVRAALSQALQRLPNLAQAPAQNVIDRLRKTLEASAKPLRDPSRVRPGTGRGRRSRNTR
jgi:hypothetical protein